MYRHTLMVPCHWTEQEDQSESYQDGCTEYGYTQNDYNDYIEITATSPSKPQKHSYGKNHPQNVFEGRTEHSRGQSWALS